MTKRTHAEAQHESAAAEAADKAPSALNTAAAIAASSPPTVGRIVIYSHPGGPDGADNPRLCAAVVTGVDDADVGGGVSLFIMHPDGAISSKHHVKQGTEFGTWHWPSRV